jgi:hypothetical protein
MSHPDRATTPITAREVGEVLADIRGLIEGTLPASEHDAVMARKRALIERLQPGFYDEPVDSVAIEAGDGDA